MTARGLHLGAALCMVAIAALLSLAPESRAVTLVTPAGQVAEPYQGWADASKMPTVPSTVTIDPDTSVCPFGRPECTGPDTDRIHFAPGTNRETLYHALGHRFDYAMPEWKRQRFLRIQNEARPWRSPPNSPHEQFAVAYALCATGATRPGKRDSWGDVGEYGYGYAPRSPRQYRRACHLIGIPQ